MGDTVFATAPRVEFSDCEFYHTMEIPGFGLVEGQWDLRGGVDAYLGGENFAGARVLEIGPASGFLTMEMERRGAEIVAIEVQDDPGWDFVPYPPAILEPMFPARRQIMARVKNSFWFTHTAHHSRAKLLYADAYNIPEIGKFDIALMGSVLLHTRAPLQIIEQCARRADTIIVTDLLHPDIEGTPVCRLWPRADNNITDTWWQLSSTLVSQFLGVLGYTKIETTTHSHQHRHQTLNLFTVVARR